MRFEELKAGSSIFIDANIFIYHFTGISEECSLLLERCEGEEILGFTTTSILLEVMHRLMMLEALARELVTPGNIAKKLKSKPEIVKQLTAYASQVQKIPEMNINIIPVTQELCYQAVAWQQKYGLMTNDSILLAACRQQDCLHLASNDSAFSQVENLTLLQPMDV
ncbi:PIN domain-containing protein [Moorella naiadis]|uniref:type II toxin-antitoxin system VapC family toxin n=1 Tax=Moorella naiadis (nom. illeg.) TaxID=3093670 RepID=UPI003D9C9C74